MAKITRKFALVLALILVVALVTGMINVRSFDWWYEQENHVYFEGDILDVGNFDDLFSFMLRTRPIQGELTWREIDLDSTICDSCRASNFLFEFEMHRLLLRVVDMPREFYLLEFEHLASEMLRFADGNAAIDGAALAEIIETAREGIEDFFHLNDVIFYVMLLDELLFAPIESQSDIQIGGFWRMEWFEANYDAASQRLHVVMPAGAVVFHFYDAN